MDQNRIWEYFQNERVDVFSQAAPRLRYLVNRARRLTRSSTPTVLNIGVGNALLEEYFVKDGWIAHSIDPTEIAVRKLKRKGVEAGVGCIEAIPYKNDTFDLVLCSEVLEHLSDLQVKMGLKEVNRVLKPGGYFLGTVPNNENLCENMVICPDCGKIFHRWGHQQQFDRRKLEKILADDLKVLGIKSKLFISWQGMNLKRKIAAFIKLLFLFFGSHGSNEILYFKARKFQYGL